MAVTKLNNPSGLKIRVNKGLDENSKLIIRSKTYSNVKFDADPDACFDVASTLNSLQKHDLYDVCKIDNTSLSE